MQATEVMATSRDPTDMKTKARVKYRRGSNPQRYTTTGVLQSKCTALRHANVLQ
jgi:hypothetical protein